MEFNDNVDFFCFRQEIPFSDKFCQKNRNCQVKLKFGASINSNMQNSVVVFISLVLDWEFPFWASLVKKIKRVSLS